MNAFPRWWPVEIYQTHTHLCVHVCTHTYMHTGVYSAYMYAHVYIHILMCVHVCVCALCIFNCPTHLKARVQDYHRQIMCSLSLGYILIPPQRVLLFWRLKIEEPVKQRAHLGLFIFLPLEAPLSAITGFLDVQYSYISPRGGRVGEWSRKKNPQILLVCEWVYMVNNRIKTNKEIPE